MTITVARRFHFVAEHHIPGLSGYDEPHRHLYVVEVEAASDLTDYFDTAKIEEWWASLPEHDDGDLNGIYKLTTVEFIAAELLGSAWRALGDAIVAVTVWEDHVRWGRAKA